MKKIFIVVVLLATLLPITAVGQIYTGTCGRTNAYPKVDSTNLLWQLNTTTRVLTITGSGQMRDYDQDSPAPWHQYRGDFDRVWVSDNATSIGEFAFWDLLADSIHIGSSVAEVRSRSFESSGFSSLVFPSSTRSIAQEAGPYCQHLKTIIFQNGVESIGYWAFAYCDSLQYLNLGSSSVYIGPYSFFLCSRLQTVTGTRVRTVDYDAFEFSYSLDSLELGDSLQYIGAGAFRCAAIRRLVIPAATTYIEGNPFDHCSMLDSISVIAGNPVYDSRNSCNAIMATASNILQIGCVNSAIPSNCVAIGGGAFSGCTRLDTISIPDNVHTIGDGAFSDCVSLRYVNLSDSVSDVGDAAFLGCTGLQSPVYNSLLFARLPHNYQGIYTMPNGIRTITGEALRDCDSLTSVVMPQSLREIRGGAFYRCHMLDTITIPSQVNQLGWGAFQECYSLTRVTLPDSITEISGYLFYNCSSLLSIVIPDNVSTIGDWSFSYCSSLQHVTIPANLGYISDAFYGCDQLSSITWNARDCQLGSWELQYYPIDDAYANGWYSSAPFYPVRHNIRTFVFGDSVRVVPRFLCYEMDSLTSLTLPCSIDSIERGAFDYCNSVTSINWNPRRCNSQASYIYSPFYTIRNNISQFTFGDSVREIPAYLCHGMSGLSQLHIPSLVSNIGPYAFRYLNQLDTIWVDSSNAYYDSRNHCNALMRTASDSLIVGCWKTDIPSDSRAIAPYAFRNVRRLTQAVVPEGVTYIGEEAFNGCRDLDSVTLPTGLTAIRDYTFQDCDSLRYLRMPDSLQTIGLRAFSNCYKLPTLTLPATLASIDDYAFSNCTGLLDIYCNPTVPPSITASTFAGSTCPIYVPCPELDAYRYAPNWVNISSRINGQFFLTFDARPNDYSYGDVVIRQEPNCENEAIVEAHPVPGYEFIGWVNQRDETMSTDSVFAFFPTENLVLTGMFQRQPDPEYDITLIAKPDDVTHGSTRIVVQPYYDIMAMVDATPAQGYAFRAWTTVDGDTLTYQKTFSFDPHTIYIDDRDTVVVVAVFERSNGIDPASSAPQLKVWAEHQAVFVTVPDDDTYFLYNINGMRLDAARGNAGATLRLNAHTVGIYFVKSRRHCAKVIVK